MDSTHTTPLMYHDKEGNFFDIGRIRIIHRELSNEYRNISKRFQNDPGGSTKKRIIFKFLLRLDSPCMLSKHV